MRIMSKVILAEARRQRLLEQLFEKGSITVGESASEFGVSTETIRKDILVLEQKGLAQKRFGGAVISEEAQASRAGTRSTATSRNKAVIAERAVELIPEGASIFIDGGTTAFALSEEVAKMEGLTIFTNSMSAVGPLSRSNNNIFIVGGRLQTTGMSNVGPWAVQAMSGTNVDIAFLGTDGLRGTTGPTSANYDESDFKRTVIASSQKTFILADSEKFGNTGLFVYDSWKSVAALITDSHISQPDWELIDRETLVILA